MIIMEGPKNIFCSSNFPWARERISSKIIDNLDTHFRKFQQVWAKGCNGPIPVQGPCSIFKDYSFGKLNLN
jgi:hypothetical protein